LREASARSCDYAERLGSIPAYQQAIRAVLGINASSALRMDLTGARWGLHGAEAVLKLRALRCNGDFETYWRYYLDQEQRRVHQTRYIDHTVPKAA
jgi:hypothetical protein